MAGQVRVVDKLSEHLEHYLELRRSVGFKLEEHARVLPDFVRHAQGRGETTVHTQSVLSWAAGASSERQVARRISMVRGFARYLVAFDPATEIPGRGLVPDAVVRSIPHIYTDAEIAVLMELALALRPEAFGATMSTLIGLMAATGLRPAEAWRLDDEHVDLTKHQLSVWHSKSGRSRRLPLHPSTAEALIRYSARRDRWHRHGRDGAFFVSALGTRLTSRVVSGAFRELRTGAPIVTRAGRRPARLGDLRHTFAVSTLLSWHRAGVDVERRLPVLSAYLGHVNPKQTYWYLEATPELMALVAERLEAASEAGR